MISPDCSKKTPPDNRDAIFKRGGTNSVQVETKIAVEVVEKPDPVPSEPVGLEDKPAPGHPVRSDTKSLAEMSNSDHLANHAPRFLMIQTRT